MGSFGCYDKARPGLIIFDRNMLISKHGHTAKVKTVITHDYSCFSYSTEPVDELRDTDMAKMLMHSTKQMHLSMYCYLALIINAAQPSLGVHWLNDVQRLGELFAQRRMIKLCSEP